MINSAAYQRLFVRRSFHQPHIILEYLIMVSTQWTEIPSFSKVNLRFSAVLCLTKTINMIVNFINSVCGTISTILVDTGGCTLTCQL